jgi:ornithine decarboxylase
MKQTAAASAKTAASSSLPFIHSSSVIDTFKKCLSDLDLDDCEPAGENAFLVCDLKRVWDRYTLWQRELGDRVEAFFAVKCNPDPVIIQLMARLGLGFDCASHQEIANVLSFGVDPDKIIYANPCKASSFIRHAAKQDVRMMTFDNADELVKVAKFHPKAKMVLRILTDDSGSLCRFGLKFGAPLAEVRGLLAKAKELNVEVIGISFHVGSGCTNPNLFGDAVARARWAFDVAKELGFSFDFLDLGGGFDGDTFVQIASVLRPAIEKHFPREEGVRVIAEPGRYFVSEAFEMATNIIARRGKGAAIDDETGEEAEEAIVMCTSSCSKTV